MRRRSSGSTRRRTPAKKQREDEAALRGDESEAVGNASLCGDVHVAMADHCQQAMAMAMFYHQLHQQQPPPLQATRETKSKKLNKGPEAEEGGALQGETEEAAIERKSKC